MIIITMKRLTQNSLKCERIENVKYDFDVS